VRVPIDDNRRLSFKDYRALIYMEIQKRHKGGWELGMPMPQGPQEAAMYRIRDKLKKTIKT
jgi:hypothetical protein